MARRRKKRGGELDTIWTLPEELWMRIEPLILDMYPPALVGRPRADLRRVLDGIIYHLRTGCQWNRLPKEFGDDSTIHRWFQRWVSDGFFEELWALLLVECDELGDVDWEWQAADGCMGKTRFGGLKSARIPRIGQNRARKRAFSSRPTAGHWPWLSPPPTNMIRSCWRQHWRRLW